MNEVILAYRRLIEKRYQHASLVEKYEIPSSFGSEKVDDFRAFFLEYVYPHPTKREELNSAFATLDEYIQKPDKIFRLLLDSATLLFKYGRHLPKIMNAGLKALRSYRTASRFELQLIQVAKNKNISYPISEHDLKMLISRLPKTAVDNFIADTEVLFLTIHDRSLVEKIEEIVTALIVRMKAKPKHYSHDEVLAMQLGKEVIHEGNRLFESLSPENQKLILETVVKIEKDNLQNIYNATYS